MIITLVKKEKGHEVIKEFTKKYESIKELERLYKETGNNLFLVDLENWKYLKENPNEEIERGEIKITNKLILTESELEILDFIKNEKPKSIRELARFLNKDIKIIHPKIKELEQIGLIELKESRTLESHL
ncbi:HVO_A0114 family putative DNA-binding protein [Methanobrevibacter curvatus]|uniref:MarR family protein n=1 Tax=Methanobrevibacter curvatus TaxID=49547 RepID=A0A165ZRP4_9EURY|nr:MarR family transcriptional regulator [Methanobrevibacter curvatus]KZX11074.1 MarR family protein [Methanobrevibacter curvatus]